MKLVPFVFGLFLIAGPALADDTAPQAVIRHQLDAFKASDGPSAYDDAAPLVKQHFPTLDSFMAMVITGYQPVARNNGWQFGEGGVDEQGRNFQKVEIDGADGQGWTATYFMEQESDGTWKVSGVRLEQNQGSNA
jgi:hypothetical protein